MAKACVDCKHYRPSSYPWRPNWCEAPQAKEFSRTTGYYYPEVAPTVLSNCDKDGWFEQKSWLNRFLGWLL